MSKTRLISGLAAGLGIVAAACWFVTGTFPLAAAPQVVNDSPGVTVEMNGAALLHRAPVAYPEPARSNGVQGTVAVEAVLDAAGNVSEARIVSGPQELRRAAQQSVLQWHFKNDLAGATRQVNITFQSQAESKPVAGGTTTTTVTGTPGPPNQNAPRKGVGTAQAQEAAQRIEQFAVVRKGAEANPPAPRTLKSITVVGLSDQMKSELLARLPVREGDTLSPESGAKLVQAVKEFDEHLRITESFNGSEATVSIATPETPTVPDRIKIGGSVQQTKLINQPHPVYPPDAKAARIQGTVKLQATIAKDGTVKYLEVISGHPLLVQAALDAVKQWVYQTTLLNGNPVEVMTEIDVNFTLSQ